MAKSYTLMTPGPVPMPEAVLKTLALPMEHHRTPEFEACFKRVLENLKKVFLTTQPVFIQTATGSGGMECALVNLLSPGDHVIAIVSGKFGERWADMAETFGAKVTRVEVPWGEVVQVQQIEDLLKSQKESGSETKLVLCQACETSTGVLHPIRELALLIAKTKSLFLVDAITALGALPIPMDEWQLDVLIGGSQKAFMLPTGLAFISFSKKAWSVVEEARCPRFYFDIRKERKANEAGESGWSAAVTHIRALDLVLDIFLHSGMNQVYARIQALSRSTHIALRELGLTSFASVPSPSLTAVKIPFGEAGHPMDGQKIRADMEKSSLVVVMGGQDQLKGKIIRIGHMGAITDDDQLLTLRALVTSLNKMQPGLIQEERLTKALSLAKAALLEAPAVVMGAPDLRA